MSYVFASDGNQIHPDSLEQTIHATAGVIDYIEVTYNGITYRQTITYTNGVPSNISQWVKQ